MGSALEFDSTSRTVRLPSGTLTFLFTYVEGSTRLWELYPDVMRLAMKRHDELIERLVEQHGGVIVRPRGEGDSRFAVFKQPKDALVSAASLQRALFSEPWGLPSALKVRMGLHTGPADLRDGDYYGPEVNRCARIRNAAYGGQTLLSQTTSDMVRSVLPHGLGLRDLGEHHLKDLQRPERIFQLLAEGVPADYPPLKTVDKPITNLPSALTSFIGRDREIDEIKQFLSHTRLLTITGPGGAGKTRLAMQAAVDLIYPFEDGVWLIDLVALSHADLIMPNVAEIFDIREEEGKQLQHSLFQYLRNKKLLFILDNCEHIVEGVAYFAVTLLQAVPELRILATSREPLGIPSEMVWRIPPLSIPEINRPVDAELVLGYESVSLFVERARSVQPTFEITEKNALSVARICKRLDGIPLAIELAAARVRVLPVEDIDARLDDRFRLLVSGSRTAMPRQQTLRALIDWSYDLLTEQERTLLRRLSIFSGGWRLVAAERIGYGGSIDLLDVLDLLTRLIDKSLVLSETQEVGEHFRFLETIRQYARERLAESGEAEEMARRHAEYFLELAETCYPQLWGQNQASSLALLEGDHENLRSALEWMAQDASRAELMLRMAGSLWRFWEIRGYVSEGWVWLKQALDATPNASTYLRANGLRGAGKLRRLMGDYLQARALHEQSLDLFRQLGDKIGIARELDDLGEISHHLGDYPKAVELHTESLALRYETLDKEGLAVSLGQLGTIAIDRGQYVHARALLEESLKLNRELGDMLYTARSLNNLGLAAYLACEYERARSLFEEALSLYRERKDNLGISQALMNLANIARDQGFFGEAKELYAQSLALQQQVGDRRGISRLMSGMAEVSIGQGDYPRAAELAERSLEMCRDLGNKRGVVVALEVQAFAAFYQGDYERVTSLANQSLAMAEEINAPRGVAYSTSLLALVASAKGEHQEAITLFSKTLEIFREIGDRRSGALMMVNMARAAYRMGEHARAEKLLDESLSVLRQLNIRWGIAYTLEIKGLLQRSRGKFKQAMQLFKDSLKFSAEQQNVQGILNCFGAIAGLEAVNGRPKKAARLFAAAENLRNQIGTRMSSDDQREYEYYRNMLRDQLNAHTFQRVWEEGKSMTLEQVLEEIDRE